MKYQNIVKGSFAVRHNRFTATVIIDGKEELCHVKNTGRLRELLLPNAVCYLEKHDKAERKTKFSLIAVENENRVVNIDSTAPNKVFYEWVKAGKFVENPTLIKPEKTFGNSRFDCYIETAERKIFVEVKGVTLKRDKTALFPDAPTERGVKHLKELTECTKQGYEAYIFFVVAMKGTESFSPNRERHEVFAEALTECKKNGVNVIALDCNVTFDGMEIDREIEVVL